MSCLGVSKFQQVLLMKVLCLISDSGSKCSRILRISRFLVLLAPKPGQRGLNQRTATLTLTMHRHSLLAADPSSHLALAFLFSSCPCATCQLCANTNVLYHKGDRLRLHRLCHIQALLDKTNFPFGFLASAFDRFPRHVF
jgi:hypothetical protein